MGRPEWRRGERSYRAQVIGVRFLLAGVLGVAASVLLVRAGVMPAAVGINVLLLGGVWCMVSFMVAFIGSITAPEKRSDNESGSAAMFWGDVFSGIPEPPDRAP
ncbi:hypothetical protein KRMM14A1004_49300 [Krasilnikovia sp. MM14-A1004]